MDRSPRQTWDARYRERGIVPGPPAPWLAENRDLLAGTRALDLACGIGRNARFLAGLGFAVDALDVSEVAIAALRGTPGVTARVADLEHQPLPAEPYDVIVIIDYLQRDLFAAAPAALRPGGVIVAETVTRAHVERLGRRFDRRFLLEPGELREAFAGLEVLRSAEGIVSRGDRPRAVASIVARRSS
ncbi:MAG: methyltransferase domain-containing protein [Solirubrobacterales bacterium]|nr:methyltransferase domain-containing protein [Solirubrobacterales bacterium]